VLLAHPQCLAHGLTLTAATTIVWYSPTPSLEIYEQANARIRRVGQQEKQLFLHLQSSAVERKVYGLLRSKQRTQDAFLEMIKTSLNGEQDMPKSNGQVPTTEALDKRIDQYLKIRKKIDEVEAGLSKLVQCKTRLDGELQAFLDANKLKSVRTTGGVLVTSSVRYSAKLEDPDIFMNYVMKHGHTILWSRASAEAPHRGTCGAATGVSNRGKP
jgi:hypothetical protein